MNFANTVYNGYNFAVFSPPANRPSPRKLSRIKIGHVPRSAAQPHLNVEFGKHVPRFAGRSVTT
jgi:hypothetical protein